MLRLEGYRNNAGMQPNWIPFSILVLRPRANNRCRGRRFSPPATLPEAGGKNKKRSARRQLDADDDADLARAAILIPAIAVDAGGATTRSALADTSGRSWFISKAFLVLLLRTTVLSAGLASLDGDVDDDEFIQAIKKAPAPTDKLAQLEGALGRSLPDDYRRFLETCNGGYVGGSLWYKGPTPTGDPADAGVHHIGGFREEPHFSLARAREIYAGRIPVDLLWIMDNPFGNAICLGVGGTHRGRIYFWDHEMEPDPDSWDGQVDTAGNVSLIAGRWRDHG